MLLVVMVTSYQSVHSQSNIDNDDGEEVKHSNDMQNIKYMLEYQQQVLDHQHHLLQTLTSRIGTSLQ